MKIRTQFTITVVLFGAMLVAVGASLILTNRQVERLHNQGAIAHELELGARELSYLSNDYLLHGEAQQRARWEAKSSSFSELLSGFALRDLEPGSLLNDIKVNQERLKAVFNDVASTLEDGSPAGGGVADITTIRVSWSRMEVQNQAMAFDASRLARMLEEQADRLGHRRVILLFVLIGVFSAFLVINYVTVNRRILRAISDLQAGTRIIGSGNLEFAIEEKKADEIGDLCRAFNRMAADLKAVTASKEDLEREMSERRQAEEALKESEAKYRNLFENMTEEVHFWQLVRDEAGRIKTWRLVDANPPTLNTWGRTALDEIKGKTTDEIFGLGATDHYMPVVQKIMTEGVPYSFVDYFPNLDKYFRLTSVPLGNHFINTGADITSIKKAEQQLRRLSQFPEENPNPVMRCTPDGVALYTNAPARQWLATFGWQADGGLPAPVRAAVAEARGRHHEIETEITNPTGRTFSIFAVQPPGEDYINLYGLDLTDRKRAEEALRESEERLRTSLGEKEVLLKEIHHRVKNNMQVISSLVALQADELQDAGMRAVLLDVTHRVRSMAMVHEKLYESADLARVEFAEYAQSLLNYLWRAHGTTASGVRLTLDLEPVSLPVNAAVPCGLILNELVGNALKHAFCGRAGGEVAVSLRGSAQGRVRLGVRDNGTGLPAGLDWRQARSLGLRLVQMLSGQLHAAVEASSDGGTQFTITFGGPKT